MVSTIGTAVKSIPSATIKIENVYVCSTYDPTSGTRGGGVLAMVLRGRATFCTQEACSEWGLKGLSKYSAFNFV